MGIFQEILFTITGIIEEKQSFRVSLPCYCLSVLIFFLQITSYAFYSTPHRVIIDEKVTSVNKILSSVLFSYPLYILGIDDVTIFFFYLLCSSIIALVTYIFAVTILRQFPEKYKNFSSTISTINRFLNKILVLFDWVLLLPFLEFLSGMAFCSSYIFIVYYRDKCTLYPIQYPVVSGIIIICIFFIGMAITVLYRNYEFNEQEFMKPKYSSNNVIQFCLLFSLALIIYYTIELSYSIMTTQLLNISFIYEIFVCTPFRNRFIMKFYSLLVFFYTVAIQLFTAWYYFQSISDSFVFYALFIVAVVTCGVADIVQERKYESIMGINHTNFNKTYKNLDVHLEELFRIENASKNDDKSKFILIRVLLDHTNNCFNELCQCKIISSQDDQSAFIDENGMIVTDRIHQLIDSIFQYGLNHPVVQENRREFENISLKYISFLTKYRNNPVQAFYRLKQLAMKQKNLGFFFKMISSILSDRIVFAMNQSQKHQHQAMKTVKKIIEKNNPHSEDVTSQQHLAIDRIIQIDNQLNAIISRIKNFSKQKVKLWRQLTDNSLNMSHLFRETLKISEYGIEIDKEVNSVFLKYQSSWKSCAKMIKVLTLFKCIVKSDTISAEKLETQFVELLQADNYNDQSTLTNFSYVKGNVAIMTLSISQDKGRILSKRNEKFLRFFNYSKEDQLAISYAEQLMPQYLGNIHSSLIDNYLSRGHSRYLGNSQQSFARTKEGYIFGVNVILNSTQLDYNDFTLNALLSVRESQKEVIIMLGDTSIGGITDRLFQKIFNKPTNQKGNNNHNRKTATSILGPQLLQNMKYNINNHNSNKLTLQDLYEKVSLLFVIPDLAQSLLQYFTNLRHRHSHSSHDYLMNQNNSYHNKLFNVSNNSTLKYLFKKDMFFQLPSQIVSLQQKFTTQMSQQVIQQQSSSNNYSQKQFKTLRKFNQNPGSQHCLNNQHIGSEFFHEKNGKNPLEDQTESFDEIINYLKAFSEFHKTYQKEWQSGYLSSLHKANVEVKLNIHRIKRHNMQEAHMSFILEIQNIEEIPIPNCLKERSESFESHRSLNISKKFNAFIGSHQSNLNLSSLMKQLGSPGVTFREIRKTEEISKNQGKQQQTKAITATPQGNDNSSSPLQQALQNNDLEISNISDKKQSYFESINSPQNSEKSNFIIESVNSPKARISQGSQVLPKHISQVDNSSLQEDQSKEKSDGDQEEEEEIARQSVSTHKITILSTDININLYKPSHLDKTEAKRHQSVFRPGKAEGQEQEDNDQLSSSDNCRNIHYEVNNANKKQPYDHHQKQQQKTNNNSFFNQQHKTIQTSKGQRIFTPVNPANSSINSSNKNNSCSIEIDVIKTINKKIIPLPLCRLRLVMLLIILIFLGMIHSSQLVIEPQINDITNTFQQLELNHNFINAFGQMSIYSNIYYKMKQSDVNVPQEFQTQATKITLSTTTFLLQQYHSIYQESMVLLSNIFSRLRFLYYTFSSQKPSLNTGSFYEVRIQNLYNAIRSAGAISANKLDYDSFFYFIGSFQASMRLQIFGNKYFLGYLNEKIDLLSAISTYIFIAEVIFYSIITVVGGYVVKQTSEHFKKILLIVTRMSIQEGQKEIKKLEQIGQSLDGIEVSNHWLRVDYNKEYYQRNSDCKINNNANLEGTNSCNSSRGTNKSIKNQKNQLISSLLKDSKVSFFGSFSLLVSLSLTSLLFLSFLIIISSKLSNSMHYSLNVYDNICSAKANFTFFLMHTEILSTYQLFQTAKISYPVMPIQTISYNLLYEIQQLKDFNENYISRTQHYSQLQELFKTDLCTAMNCEDKNKAHSFNGLSDLISQSIGLVSIFQELMFYGMKTNNNTYVSFNPRYKKILNSYLINDQYINIVMNNHLIPQSAFQLAKSQAHNEFQAVLDQFSKFSLLYFNVLSTIFLGLLIPSLVLLYYKIKRDMKKINFSLFFITYEKLKEENTKHLLKQLSKDYK